MMNVSWTHPTGHHNIYINKSSVPELIPTAKMAATKTSCHMASGDLVTSEPKDCKKAASLMFGCCWSQRTLLLFLLCVGTLFTPTLQAATMSPPAPIRYVRSAMTTPTDVSLRPPNKSLRGSSAPGVRGAPTGAQPPLVRSLQPPSATTSFRRGGLRRHDAPGTLNRGPTSPIATSSTRSHYRGGGLRSWSPAQEIHLFNTPSTKPDLTRNYSGGRTSAELPPSVISYRGNSREANYLQQESQVQEIDITNQPILDQTNNVIGIKMTSPEGKTTIEFMQPPVFDSSNNPIILDLATLEESIGIFNIINETDYEYDSSSEGGIWDEEEDESGIWGTEGNQGWDDNVGGWSTVNRRGWEMDKDDIESTKRIDTYGHIIEEDLSHGRKGYSPRRNHQRNNFDNHQTYPEPREEVLHRQVIPPQIQENVNRKTLSLTDIMRATNNTADDLVEILKQKGIVFKDFLQLLKDGSTLQHVKALLSTPNITTSTSTPDKENSIFTTVLPSTTAFDTVIKEDFDSDEEEEIFTVEHGEINESDWAIGRNGGNSDKRHNRHGKSRRKNSNNREKKGKKKSKDSVSHIFNDPLYSTDILPVHSTVYDNEEESFGAMASTMASTANLLESIEDLKTSTTISPEILPGGLRKDSLTPPPSKKISEATIIAISVEETLHMKSSDEKTVAELEKVKNSKVRKPTEEIHKQEDEDFKWDKNHLEEDYVQDIYTKPLDPSWQLTQVENDIKDYNTLGHTQDEHHVISQDALEEQIFEYKFPIKGLLVISGILGALAVLTFAILISYAVIKCTKPPPDVHNYQVNEQKSVT